MISMEDAFRVLDEHRNDAAIMTTMSSGKAEFSLAGHSPDEERNFRVPSCMGKASSFGLGVALARPQQKVLVLDGDGSLLMNLGTLVTIAEKAPENLYHFIFDNGIYAVTGSQAIPAADKVRYEELARAAGYAASYRFSDVEELATGIGDVLHQRGPVLVSLAMRPDPYIKTMPKPGRDGKMPVIDLRVWPGPIPMPRLGD